jgi:hypothetical protein
MDPVVGLWVEVANIRRYVVMDGVECCEMRFDSVCLMTGDDGSREF